VLPLCSLSSNTHSAAPRNGETSLVTYYEDPRRFSSRVIGLSFQGPRGGRFLPSGSRYLVSLVSAVKDFLKTFFSRLPNQAPWAALRRPGGSVSGGGVCLPSFSSASSFVGFSRLLSFLGISNGSGLVGTRLMYSSPANPTGQGAARRRHLSRFFAAIAAH
jgi:hypothetical protein